MTPAWLPNPAAPLIDFGMVLGVNPKVWSDRERVDGLSFVRTDLAVSATARMEAAHLRSLAQFYGDALTCRFRLGDLILLDARSDVDDAAVDAFREDVEGSPTVTLDVALNKLRLVERDLGLVAGCRIVLYLFPEALERALRGTLSEVERLLWPDEVTRKAIILVPSREIWLDGALLAVLGGSASAEWQSIARVAEADKERVRWVYDACRGSLKWQDDWLRYLTPMHLALSGRAADDDAIHMALLAHQTSAVVLYTADRSVIRAGRWVSTYADPHQRVDIVLATAGQSLGAELPDGAHALLGLAEWTYDKTWFGDRLPLVQLGMVQGLRTVEESGRYAALLRSAPGILSSVQWHWKAVVAGKVAAYSSAVRSLEDYVATTAQGFADQTDAMIDRLSTAMLAAVGVLLGSFVAALFREGFDVTIFRIGLAMYAVYVLVFPFTFGLLHEWQRYQSLVDTFANRRRRFEEQIPPDRVEEIVGQRVVSGSRTFRQWFCAVKIVYAVVIVATLIAWITVPSWMPASSLGAGAFVGTPVVPMTTSIASTPSPSTIGP